MRFYVIALLSSVLMGCTHVSAPQSVDDVVVNLNESQAGKVQESTILVCDTPEQVKALVLKASVDREQFIAALGAMNKGKVVCAMGLGRFIPGDAPVETVSNAWESAEIWPVLLVGYTDLRHPDGKSWTFKKPIPQYAALNEKPIDKRGEGTEEI